MAMRIPSRDTLAAAVFVASLPLAAYLSYHEMGWSKPVYRTGGLSERAVIHFFLLFPFLMTIVPSMVIVATVPAFLIKRWRRGERWQAGLSLLLGVSTFASLVSSTTSRLQLTGPTVGYFWWMVFAACLLSILGWIVLVLLAAVARRLSRQTPRIA
jgi:hypothetical protein